MEYEHILSCYKILNFCNFYMDIYNERFIGSVNMGVFITIVFTMVCGTSTGN